MPANPASEAKQKPSWVSQIIGILFLAWLIKSCFPSRAFLLDCWHTFYVSLLNYRLYSLIQSGALEPLVRVCFKLVYFPVRIFNHFVIPTLHAARGATAVSTALEQESGGGRSVNKPSNVAKPLSSYQFRPIAGDDEIRLFSLLPVNPQADDSKALECRISHVNLSSAPPYVALSYCWKDDSIPDTYTLLHIPASSEYIVITENLARALRHARDDANPSQPMLLLLWVDQICIDQKNVAETSSQVALMSRIYSTASLVRIWLGEDTPNSYGARAFKLAARLAKAVKETDIQGQTKPLIKLSPQQCAKYRIPTLREAAGDYLALTSLWERPWFSRAWVVQEVSFRYADAFCGTSRIPFEDLCSALFCCEIPLKAPASSKYSLRTGQAFAAMLRTRISLMDNPFSHPRPSRTLLSLLTQHRCCESTMPQDKVFAFLGLAEDKDEIGIRPDYSLTASQVYLQTASAMLRHYPHLDVLSAVNPVRFHDPETTSVDLPSWVPDWSNPDVGASLRTRGYFGETMGDFAASGRTTTSSPPAPQFRNNGTHLGVSGLTIDKITAVGDIYEPQYKTTRAEEHALFKQWERIAGAHTKQKYPATGEAILAAYIQTITAGGQDIVTRGLQSLRDHSGQAYTIADELWPLADSFTAQYIRYVLLARMSSLIARVGVDPVRSPLAYSAMVTVVGLVVSVLDNIFDVFGEQSVTTVGGDYAFQDRLVKVVTGRRLFRTQNGYLGLAVDATCGDHIAVLAGGKVPLVIRQRNGQGVGAEEWELVSDAYVHGVMFGEAFDENRCKVMWFR